MQITAWAIKAELLPYRGFRAAVLNEQADSYTLIKYDLKLSNVGYFQVPKCTENTVHPQQKPSSGGADVIRLGFVMYMLSDHLSLRII